MPIKGFTSRYRQSLQREGKLEVKSFTNRSDLRRMGRPKIPTYGAKCARNGRGLQSADDKHLPKGQLLRLF